MTGATALLGLARQAKSAGAAPVGVELYTVRNLLPKDAEGTLRAISEIGYRQAEGDRATLLKLAPLLKKYNLTTPSVMLETPLVTGSWPMWKVAEPGMKRVEWNEALDSVRSLGARYAVLAYLLPAERGKDPDAHKRFADSMNAAGERCRAAGLQFCYHNHAFEFGGRPGERVMDILLERFDPKLVAFEVDVFWVSSTGNDPAEFLKTVAGRVALVHLKDKRAGSPVLYSEDVKPETFVEVGSGSIDFPAVLKAAAAAGVKQYHVEQDETPGNPLASLRKSYDYLRGLHAPELAM
jgi:sugar phosphate isomerase/epimerase